MRTTSNGSLASQARACWRPGLVLAKLLTATSTPNMSTTPTVTVDLCGSIPATAVGNTHSFILDATME